VVETALPEGYPAPTPPGAVELKRYPAIRRAEVVGRRSPDQGRNGAFYSLFRHIQSRDIAMTSPVEMDYPGWTGDASSSPESWTMSFVYRTPTDGPTEQTGNVRVVDTTPVTVVAVGVRGEYGRATVEGGLRQLNAWLDGQTEWERAGSPRVLYYNGPYIPDYRKWSEVQIPVRPADAGSNPAESAVEGKVSSAGEEVGAILRGTFRAGGPDRSPASDAGSETG
jgi:hypothetical protein